MVRTTLTQEATNDLSSTVLHSAVVLLSVWLSGASWCFTRPELDWQKYELFSYFSHSHSLSFWILFSWWTFDYYSIRPDTRYYKLVCLSHWSPLPLDLPQVRDHWCLCMTMEIDLIYEGKLDLTVVQSRASISLRLRLGTASLFMLCVGLHFDQSPSILSFACNWVC